MWAGLLRSSLLLFLSGSAAAPSSLVEGTAELDCCNDVRDSALEEVDEAEFMRVSLLQGLVRLDPSQRTLLVADPPHKAAGKVSTAIDAAGGMEEELSGHFPAGAGARATVPPPVALEPRLAEGTLEDGTEAAEAAASFMQTEIDLQAASLQNTSLLAVRESRRADLDGGCATGLTSLTTHIQLETFRVLGLFPQRPHCMAESSTAVSLLEIAHTNYFSELSSKTTERLILLGYVTIYFICVWYMWHRMVHPMKLGERPVRYENGRKVITELDIEEETWRTSLTGWLACSWASTWVARWGVSLDAALTKIKADDLPQIGTREYQASESAGIFKKLWQEEIERKGQAKAAIFSVVLALWSKRLMIQLLVSIACQQTVAQLYGVVLTEKGLNYFAWLQKEKAAHPDKEIPLAIPMLCVIVLFSAMPIITVIISSISNNLARRMDQKLSGAFCIALFEKAQRLPSTCLHSTLIIDKETGKEVERPAEVDLMQLITYDVNTNILGAYTQIALCFNSLIATVVFTSCLWMRLRWATLIAFAVSIPTIFCLGYVSQKMAEYGYKLQATSDSRVRILRELIWGMKVVKSYAWEDDAESRIMEARKRELSLLEMYWAFIGVLMGIALTFPRLMVIGALWGYCEMYGTHDVANIFVCMQLLGMLKAACEGLAAALSRAIVLQPSLQRVEDFLKMAEAPVLLPDRKPDWVDMWPKNEADAETRLEVKGTFAWRAGGPAVLHDIDLSVKKGEMVAIVGKVGSGKSTLLQVVLGELHPVKPEQARLSRPEILAYCSQVAHIGEGTLRENVLFGQEYKAERYNEALAGASLEADLKVLPGGDGVCIGSRGITLSGGQKARVAMARAAFHQGSDLVLIDDPFGAVDAPTAMTLLHKLLLGPLMKGRTLLVVMQPDAERLQLFDRAVILDDGRILEQGTPEEVMKTSAFESLLSSTSRRFDSGTVEEALAVSKREPCASLNNKKEDNRAMRVQLREEDFEGRPTLDMVRQYCKIGRWRNLWNSSILYCVMVFLWLLADLVLANWTNAIASSGTVNDRAYITAYIFWTCCGSFTWVVTWKFGMWFTLRISSKILGMMLSKLLRAPIDKFFDKHPVGRIMNRMVADVAAVDFSLYLRTTGTIAVIYTTVIPLMYIHFILPWFITVLAAPVYYLMFNLCHRYWNTTVPLRYCAVNSRSEVNNLIAEVSGNSVVIRAFGGQDRQIHDMADHFDDMLKATLYGERILRRWIVNRILFLWSFYITTVYLVGIFNTQWMGAGTLGLCLGNLILLEALIEPNLDHATGCQMEFIALARIHEYMNIPQEKPRHTEGDSKYRSFMVSIKRATLGNLSSTGEGVTVQVLRDGRPILQAAPNGRGLVAPKASSLQELCLENSQLKETDAWHQVVSVNDAFREADLMVEELCTGQSSEVVLEVQSGWLVDGARVVVESLKAGYADIPRDILKGISVTFEPKAKVAITGTTGCGKSSLLLVMLRLLEPRAGRVLLNGVDTREVGLATLRQSLGLVPQDPVLFSGSLKKNLDPFGSYPDSRLWKALSLAHLSDLVSSWAPKLNFQIAEEGSNLSFGQRQLICLARMVLRQPALLLLDEATSAIDPRTQEEVQNTIVTAFPHSTLVAVAHRLETILDFDYVCVMERGEVIEQGVVKEVSQRRGGRLRSMLEAKRSW